jgi:hypothetical protein
VDIPFLIGLILAVSRAPQGLEPPIPSVFRHG